MEINGERTRTCTFENHTSLLLYVANWPLYTLENGFWGITEHQGSPFLGFAQALSASIVRMNLPEQGPTKHGMLCRLHNYVHGYTSTIHLRSNKFSLPSLYLLCLPSMSLVINYSRSSTGFLHCKQWKARQGLELRLMKQLRTPLSGSILLY